MSTEYKTKLDATLAADAASREALAFRFALTDIMDGKAAWIEPKRLSLAKPSIKLKPSDFRIWLTRLNAPHGGLVIIPRRDGIPTAEVYYADDWLDMTRRAITSVRMSDTSPEADRARVMYELCPHVDAARRKACGLT